MDRVSATWSNIIEPQQCSCIMKLLKYSLHLTESDLTKQHTIQTDTNYCCVQTCKHKGQSLLSHSWSHSHSWSLSKLPSQWFVSVLTVNHDVVETINKLPEIPQLAGFAFVITVSFCVLSEIKKKKTFVNNLLQIW